MSATSRREAKRAETARRIVRAAAELTVERGFEGWTMDDLAAAADTSRRTLFNYVPSKDDAVLGPVPVLPADELATFRAGGPTGDLLADTASVARRVLEEEAVDPAVIRLHRRLLRENPRFLGLVHERLEALVAEFASEVEAREGPDSGPRRARLLAGLVLLCFDAAVEALGEGDEHRPVVDLFDEAVAEVRSLL